MSLTDVVTTTVSVLGRKKSALAYPTEQPRAPAIEAKLAAATARVGELRSSYNAHALAAAEEPEHDGPAHLAFDRLKQDIDAAERTVADLGAALTEAKAHDEALLARTKAALHRNQIHAVQKHLARRDAAAADFSAAIAKAVEAYKTMHDAAGKAWEQARPMMAGTHISGYRFQPSELHRDACYEVARLSVPFPKPAGKPVELTFPNAERIVAGINSHKRATLKPMAELYKELSAGLVDELLGRGPKP